MFVVSCRDKTLYAHPVVEVIEFFDRTATVGRSGLRGHRIWRTQPPPGGASLLYGVASPLRAQAVEQVVAVAYEGTQRA